MDVFLVDRGPDKSVIAGYPWFLDWGRDSLISVEAWWNWAANPRPEPSCICSAGLSGREHFPT